MQKWTFVQLSSKLLNVTPQERTLSITQTGAHNRTYETLGSLIMSLRYNGLFRTGVGTGHGHSESRDDDKRPSSCAASWCLEWSNGERTLA